MYKELLGGVIFLNYLVAIPGIVGLLIGSVLGFIITRRSRKGIIVGAIIGFISFPILLYLYLQNFFLPW